MQIKPFLILMMICLTIPGAGQSHVALPERGLCAHRGAMQTHPENTIAAFKEAIRAGAHTIEVLRELKMKPAKPLFNN